MTTFNPKFLTKNAITDVSQLSVSVGTGDTTTNKLRLIDRNPESLFVSTESSGGVITILWTPTISTTISRCFFQNASSTFALLPCTASIIQNGTVETTSFYITPIVSNHYLEFDEITLDPSTNDYIEINFVTGTHPNTINLGQMYFGTEYFTTTASGTCVPKSSTSQNTYALSDGTIVKNWIRDLVGYEIDLQAVSASEQANYYNLRKTNRTQSFVFIPRPAIYNPPTSPDTWDGLAGHYNWTNPFEEFYHWTDDISVNGFNGKIVLEQAGGTN